MKSNAWIIRNDLPSISIYYLMFFYVLYSFMGLFLVYFMSRISYEICESPGISSVIWINLIFSQMFICKSAGEKKSTEFDLLVDLMASKPIMVVVICLKIGDGKKTC